MISGSRTFLIATRLAGLLCGSAQAGQPSAPIDQVMLDLQSAGPSSAHFSEDKYSEALTEPLRDEGTLIFMPPDHVEKRTDGPEAQSLSVTGNTLTIVQDGGTRTLELSDYPEIGGFVEGIRSTLKGDLGVLRHYYEVGFLGNENDWTLTLQPGATTMSQMVISVRITGSKGHVKTVETINADGERSEMTITPLPAVALP